MQPIIYTIGHSNRSIEAFIKIISSNEIEVLVDVRHFPGSRKFPHFNSDVLASSLLAKRIGYHHLVELGGRRKLGDKLANNGWRHPAFKAYAEHMKSELFMEGITKLMLLATANTVAFMCSEALWWRCHRSLIADYLKADGWKVLHAMSENTVKEHPYTSVAKVVEGKLLY